MVWSGLVWQGLVLDVWSGCGFWVLGMVLLHSGLRSRRREFCMRYAGSVVRLVGLREWR